VPVDANRELGNGAHSTRWRTDSESDGLQRRSPGHFSRIALAWRLNMELGRTERSEMSTRRIQKESDRLNTLVGELSK